PDGEHGIESGGDGDVESAIGVKNGGMGAVPSKVAAGNDEHGNFGPVFGGVENLFDIVRSRVKSDGRFEEHLGGVAAQVVAINGGRIKKGREPVIDGLGIVTAGDAADGAEGWQGQFALRAAVLGEELELALGDDFVIDEDFASGHGGALNNAFGLGHKGAPMARVRVIEVSRNNAASGGLHGGLEEERLGVVINDDVFGVVVGVESLRRRVDGRVERVAQIDIVELILGSGAVLEVDEQIPAIFGHVSRDDPFGQVRAGVN